MSNHLTAQITYSPYHLRFDYTTSVIETFSTYTYIDYNQPHINHALATDPPMRYTNYSGNILNYAEYITTQLQNAKCDSGLPTIY